jgi:hypothetical protein
MGPPPGQPMMNGEGDGLPPMVEVDEMGGAPA